MNPMKIESFPTRFLSRTNEQKYLKELSTFGIGGPARFYIEVAQIDEMQELLAYCRSTALPYFILGKGSNCLFDDRGFNGLVIVNKIDFIERLPSHVFHVGSGYSFSL